tara:strand:- start:3953 stop:5161 length:1209 start_codon:yes stop_codon:yes gene_type:complete
MIDTLPEDIINLILNFLESSRRELNKSKLSFFKMDINYILSLRKINKFFKGYIEKQQNTWEKIVRNNYNGTYNNFYNLSVPILNSRSNEIDDLCLKNTPLNIFRWLFDNNLYLSVKNIQKLIIKNRIDVLKLGFHYDEFLKTLFNRFYLCSSNDILSLSQNISPISTALQYNRLEIIKLLLESSSHGNPYLEQIDTIFNESIKYIKIGILNYLVVNHYDKLKEQINRKFLTIILRFDNIEDTLFYIIINNKAKVTRDTIKSIISKNYIDLFKYCYKKYNFYKCKNNSDLLLKCVETYSFVIFDYLMSEEGVYINPDEFSSVFLSKRKHNTLFLNMILDKYLYLIINGSNIISVAIKNKVNNERIEQLIMYGYKYDEKDIINVLNDKNFKLAKTMINLYPNIP